MENFEFFWIFETVFCGTNFRQKRVWQFTVKKTQHENYFHGETSNVNQTKFLKLPSSLKINLIYLSIASQEEETKHFVYRQSVGLKIEVNVYATYVTDLFLQI